MSDVIIVDPGGAPGFVEVPQPVDPTIVTLTKGEKGDPGIPGADGQPGRDGIDGQDGAPGRDGTPGVDGRDGTDGLSAYEVAVAAGFVGTEAEWLASLVGPAGADGAPGRDGVDGQDGAPGRDGADGQPGRDGVDGSAGEKGDKGDPGAPGTPGTDGADGAPGVGVPTGGAVGQVLTKTGTSDYVTGWADAAGGSLPTRQTTTILAAIGAGSVELAPAFTILSVDYTSAARLRLYRTAAGRDADAARPVAVAYPGRRGRIYEYVATTVEEDAEGSVAGSTPTGSTVYFQVDGGPVDITITYLEDE